MRLKFLFHRSSRPLPFISRLSTPMIQFTGSFSSARLLCCSGWHFGKAANRFCCCYIYHIPVPAFLRLPDPNGVVHRTCIPGDGRFFCALALEVSGDAVGSNHLNHSGRCFCLFGGGLVEVGPLVPARRSRLEADCSGF